MREEVCQPETCSGEVLELRTDFSINIEFGLVGLALRVGCQTLYLTDEKEALKYLTAYFEDKKKWVEAYSNGTLKTLLNEIK